MNNNFFKILIVVALLSATAVSAEKGSGKNFDKNLGKGEKNDEVVELQKNLAEHGFLNVEATGFFGPVTEQAVKDFQKAHGIPDTGFVGPLTRGELNKLSAAVVETDTTPVADVNIAEEQKIEKQIDDLLVQVRKLQDLLASMQSARVTEEARAKAGIIITGGVSGPGYPTGPLNISLSAVQLLFDRPGQVKGAEVTGRQYETPLDDTVPPIGVPVPITINGVANTAGVKIISNMKKNQHQGTINIDDTVPALHATLQYNGTATVVGSTITSRGTFKTSKCTGVCAGLVAEGTYEMTITEPAQLIFGAPVIVSLTTVSP